LLSFFTHTHTHTLMLLLCSFLLFFSFLIRIEKLLCPLYSSVSGFKNVLFLRLVTERQTEHEIGKNLDITEKGPSHHASKHWVTSANEKRFSFLLCTVYICFCSILSEREYTLSCMCRFILHMYNSWSGHAHTHADKT
jgi:hypothetical protein